MGLDARVRYTKMMIQKNFVALLQQKPLKRITVKEICDKAEINRATFYKYYMDAFDLLDKIEEEILLGLRVTIQQSLKDGLHGTLVEMLKKLQEDGSVYTALFTENGDAGFTSRIFQVCYTELAETIARQFPGMGSAQQKWVYTYVVQGASGLVNDWIAGGMAEPPETVATFTERLISGTLESIPGRA